MTRRESVNLVQLVITISDNINRLPSLCAQLASEQIKECYSHCCKKFIFCKLIPQSKVRLVSPIELSVVKKFPTFNGTQKFITVYAKASHLSVTSAT
jgi:hypothetical protein